MKLLEKIFKQNLLNRSMKEDIVAKIITLSSTMFESDLRYKGNSHKSFESILVMYNPGSLTTWSQILQQQQQ